MTEQTQPSAAPSGASPARIDLEDFIEAVTRGVARAVAAQEDVGGYALPGKVGVPAGILGGGGPTILVGIIAQPSGPFDPNVLLKEPGAQSRQGGA